MRALGWALAVLAPCMANAQLQLFLTAGGEDRPAGALVDLGQVASGDLLDAKFRVVNAGAAPADFRTLAVSGTGFTVYSKPSLPFTMAPGSAQSFVVRFQPAAAGAYSANLAVNGGSTILLAAALPAPALYLDQGATAILLHAGTVTDFGRIERDARASRRFKLQNETGVRLSIDAVSVSGAAFAGPDGIAAPMQLDPKTSATFDVTFAPTAAGSYDGALRVGTSVFPLHGEAVDPPLPRPRLLLDTASPSSSQQVTLQVKLAEKARAGGYGELRLEFRPLQTGALDPAIQFLATGSRFATLQVSPGEDVARFDGASQIRFQTGTTAGTLVFTVKLGDYTESATVVVPPAAVGVDTLRALRSGSSLDIQFSGFDNTRSISDLAFTFYDQAGNAIDPGAIHCDAGADFRRYFDASQKDVGGLFNLRVVFPVSGNAAGIAAVDIAVTNSSGVVRPPRVSF